tara:strand:- start:86 stop:856 length:771 start_codon:yes stop_codon:yes gene_type:complete
MNDTLFPVFEAKVTYDTPSGDVPTNYKLIVRKDNHKILSCMTNDYKLVENQEIWDIANPIITKNGGKLKETIAFGEGARTVTKWHFPNHKVKVGKDDDMTPEIIIKNSYDGTVGVNILAGAFRLVCSNGMVIGVIATDYKNKHSVYNVALKDIDGVIHETITRTKAIFKDEFPILQDTDIKEKHIVKFLEMFPIQANSIVTQKLIADTPKTFWDLFNVGTSVTTHNMDRNSESTHKLEDALYKKIKGMALSEVGVA